MKTNLFASIRRALIACLIAPGFARAGDVLITPTAVSSSTAATDFFPAAHLIDGSGLSGSPTLAAPGTHAGASGSNAWVTRDSGPDYFAVYSPPVLTFTLGQATQVSEMVIWGYYFEDEDGQIQPQGNEGKVFLVAFSTDGTNFANSITLTNSSPAVAAAVRLAFPATRQATHIRVTITDNHYGGAGVPAGGDRVGLGEIRFGFRPPVYSVNNSGDTGAGSGAAGDLRYCINQANLKPGSEISFASAAQINLSSRLPLITAAMTIDSGGRAVQISGGGQHRIFFVDAPGATVNFTGLTIANGKAVGGAGGYPGGGAGAGLGGGLFVNSGAVTLSDVHFLNNAAVGGKGGDGATSISGGGGGGLHGAGGAQATYGGGAGGGGFGGTGGNSQFGGGGGGGFSGNGGGGHPGASGNSYGGGGGGLADGQNATATSVGSGVAGGGNGGGNATPAQQGGLYGGGGGGGGTGINVNHSGGNGGKFGGGGGASPFSPGLGVAGGNGGDFGGGGGNGTPATGNAGAGGFGGGGGAGSHNADVGMSPFAGAGGFGGGGGGGRGGAHWAFGGAFGGAGGHPNGNNVVGGGGGGAGLGGAIFLRGSNGASLNIAGGSFSGNSVTEGLPGAKYMSFPFDKAALPGTAIGAGIFLHGGTTTLTVDSGTRSLTFPVYDAAVAGAPAFIAKAGPGSLVLTAANAYAGGTSINAGTLVSQNAGALGTGPVYVMAGRLELEANLTVSLGLGEVLSASGGGTGIINSNNGSALTVQPVVQNFKGTITGSTSLIFPAGVSGGYQVLSGANTYSGATTVHSYLSISHPTALGATSAGTTVMNGGILELWASGDSPGTLTCAAEPLTLADGAIFQVHTGGILRDATFPGPITLPGGAGPLLRVVSSNSGSMNLSGAMSGAGGVRIHAASGPVIFSGTAKTYTGNTTVGAGTLALNAFLADASTITVATGGILRLDHNQIDQVAALVIDGVAKPNGLYGAIGSADPNDTEIGSITGTGRLRVAPALTPFQQWAASYALTAASAQPGANPDGDTDSNADEFFLGGNPASASDSVTRAVAIADTNGDAIKELTLTVQVRSGAAFTASGNDLAASVDGITCRVEGSLNLTDFDSAVSEVTPHLGAGAPRAGYQFKTFRLYTSGASARRGFLRVLVTSP